MSRKEWQKVKEIFEDALELGKDERKVYLDEACAGNDDLRRSVENLLDSFNDTGTVSEIESQGYSYASAYKGGSMVEPGEQIGRFEIIKNLATGGMGEVYLAKDTRLDRKVAIKFLRKEFSEAIDPLHRFEREAKSASALNHPNIITIYEVGTWKNADFIAMEFVDGVSVRQILNEKGIDANEALAIATQVASALSAAHAAGIIHRDIKPENLMRRPDGLVKVLDFGLAKQTVEAREKEEVDSDAVTRRANSTIPGMILGTVAYMSPEQARGRKTDARTDIWSLGVVLYEMLTGKTPFSGETKSDLLVGILKGEPELLSDTGSEPIRELNNVLKKALAKDKDERYQNIKELLLDLKIIQNELSSGDHKTELLRVTTREEAAMSTDATEPAKSEALSPSRNAMWPIIPVALLAAIFGFWYLWQRQPSEVTPLSSLSTAQVTSWKSELGESATTRARLSPDGKLIAFVANKDGHPSIWLKQLDGGEAFTRKQDDSSDKSPVWSPDGSQIAYASDRGGSRGIWREPALGGAATLISPVDSPAYLSEWSKDGSTIYFEMQRNLYALNVADGQLKKLTNFDKNQLSEHNFDISPDGKRLVYSDIKNGQTDIWMSDLDGSGPVQLTNDTADDNYPIWLPDGKRVLYNSERNGIKQICLAFTTGREPQQLTLSDSDNMLSDVSADGTRVVYISTKDDSDIWGVSLENGKEFQVTSDIGVEFWPDVSINGTIAYQAIKQISIGDKLLTCELFAQQISGETRLVQFSKNGFYPRWSPDGKKIAFLQSDSADNSLWIASGTGGDARRFTEGGVRFGGYATLPYSRVQTQDLQWSPDNSSLVYVAVRSGVSNIWRVAADGSGETQLTNNQDAKLLYFNPLLTPDGKGLVWLAMNLSNPKARTWGIWSLRNGNAEEIYRSDGALRIMGWAQTGNELIVTSVENKQELSPFPVDVSLLKVSAAGGQAQPIATLKAVYFNNIRLSPDSRTITFVERPDGSDTIRIMSLADRTQKTVTQSNDSRVYFSSLAFSPDSKSLYYGKQANWQVISMVSNFK
ncbi:MAG TPA: protein kinase [Pyrinomonadaceae bacterium]|nr:protein kinase [Pyrinomonadaceae bacterium]